MQKKVDDRRAEQALKQETNQARARAQAHAAAEMDARARQGREAFLARQMVQTELRLQMLQGQAAVAEAQAAGERAWAYQQMTEAIRERRLRDAQLNGSGIYYIPNGPMTPAEFPSRPR